MSAIVILVSISLGIILLYRGRGLLAWLVPAAGWLGAWVLNGARPFPLFVASLSLLALVAILFGVMPIRRLVIS